MNNGVILLVEDNQDDELLTLDAFAENKIFNPVVVVRDGVQALDYLFGTGEYAGRDTLEMPAIVLLDLKLSKLDGLEVLKRIREDDRTRHQPVVILTSSNEDQDRLQSFTLGANSFVRKPVDFDEFIGAAGNLGLYWLLLNQAPPVH